MAQDDPVGANVLDLLDRDLASEGAVGLVVDVLRGDADFAAEEVAGVGEVEGWWGDDDLCRRELADGWVWQSGLWTVR